MLRFHSLVRGAGALALLLPLAVPAVGCSDDNAGGAGGTGGAGSGSTGTSHIADVTPPTVVSSFPAHNGEQLMLVTDQAKLIRTTVGDIRVAGRNTQGVTIFRVADDEHVVSAARIEESDDEAEADLGDTAEAPETDPQTGGDTAEDLADGSEA